MRTNAGARAYKVQQCFKPLIAQQFSQQGRMLVNECKSLYNSIAVEVTAIFDGYAYLL